MMQGQTPVTFWDGLSCRSKPTPSVDHILKQRHRVTNSAAYDVALRQRGSLTVWFTDAAIAA